MPFKPGNPQTYEYYVNLDERGYFDVDVRNQNGKTVWRATDEDEDGEFWPARDGFMRHGRDIDGLEKYLKALNIMPKNSALVMGN